MPRSCTYFSGKLTWCHGYYPLLKNEVKQNLIVMLSINAFLFQFCLSLSLWRYLESKLISTDSGCPILILTSCHGHSDLLSFPDFSLYFPQCVWQQITSVSGRRRLGQTKDLHMLLSLTQGFRECLIHYSANVAEDESMLSKRKCLIVGVIQSVVFMCSSL